MGKSTSFDVLATAKAVGFDEASRKINKLGDDCKKSMSGLVTAALALGPALIPIAAAAIGISAGPSARAAVTSPDIDFLPSSPSLLIFRDASSKPTAFAVAKTSNDVDFPIRSSPEVSGPRHRVPRRSPWALRPAQQVSAG